MQKNVSLTSGSVFKRLVAFAVPVLLANVLQVLYSTVDLMVVGRFATTGDISGVTISSQIMVMITVGVSGLSTGVTVLMGQYTGARSERDLSKTVGAAVALFGALAAALLIPLLLLNTRIVDAMNTPAEAVSAARSYLLVCTMGIPFLVGYNVTSCIFRGIGDSKTPLKIIAISCVTNIVVDLLLVAVLHMGALGAAIATATSQAVSFTIALLIIRRRGLGFRVFSSDIRPNWKYIGKIGKIGLPISLQETLISFSFLIITYLVNERGVIASAAVGIVEKLIGFTMMPTMAISAAVAAMAAQNFGALQNDRARKTLWSGVLLSLIPATLINLFVLVAPQALPSIFSSEQAVIESAALYLRTYVLDCFFVCIVFNFNSFFASCNRSLFSMAHSLLTTFAIRVPIAYFFARLATSTLLEIGLAAPASSLVSALMCLGYFVILLRKERRSALPA